jgi:hypothetical protein
MRGPKPLNESPQRLNRIRHRLPSGIGRGLMRPFYPRLAERSNHGFFIPGQTRYNRPLTSTTFGRRQKTAGVGRPSRFLTEAWPPSATPDGQTRTGKDPKALPAGLLYTKIANRASPDQTSRDRAAQSEYTQNTSDGFYAAQVRLDPYS